MCPPLTPSNFSPPASQLDHETAMTMQSSLQFFLHAPTTHGNVTRKIVLNRCRQREIRLNKYLCKNVAFNPDKTKHCARHGQENTNHGWSTRRREIKRAAQRSVAENRHYTAIPNTRPESSARAVCDARIRSTAVTRSPSCSMSGAVMPTNAQCLAATKSPRTQETNFNLH